MIKKKHPLIVLLFFIVIGIIIGSLSEANANKSNLVKLRVNEEIINLEVKDNTVKEILELVNITDFDDILLDKKLTETIKEDTTINVRTKQQFLIEYQGVPMYVNVFKNKVEDILEELKLDYTEEDIIKPSLNSFVSEGDMIKVIKVDTKEKEKEIEIENNIEYKVVDKDINHEKVIEKGSKGLLKETYLITSHNGLEVNVSLEDTELVKKPKNKIIEKGNLLKKEKSLDFETDIKYDNSLYQGNSKTTQKGKKGKEIKTYEVDLKTKNKKLIDTEIIKPVKEIIVKGTKKKPVKKVNNKSAYNFSGSSTNRTLNMIATAYSADPAENGGWNVTALGTPLRRGVCAVDPNVIPLGTKLHVSGYGYCRAEDTGGAIKGNIIDVLIPNKSEVYRWGRRNVTVRILK